MKNSLRTAIQLTLVSTALVLNFSVPQLAKAATWTTNGPMSFARIGHTATMLSNGKVLVAGGVSTNLTDLSSAELYDPATGTWKATGSMNIARSYHTATFLPNGKVLVAGGANGTNAIASTELYDPATGTWSVGPATSSGRSEHTATLLPNGNVLIAAGVDSGHNSLSSAELYDPKNNTWTGTGSLNSARRAHTTTLLPDGKVLVTGGRDSSHTPGDLNSSELYDPSTGTWTTNGFMFDSHWDHTATLLPDGSVIVAGGFDLGATVTIAEVYRPFTDSWMVTNPMVNGRALHTATLLPNGKVLLTGGRDTNGSDLSSAELYDPLNGSWTATSALNTARYGHTATLLASGKVLVVGGFDGTNILSSTEIYDYANGSWTNTGAMHTARENQTATLMPDGKVLIAGGDNGGSPYLQSSLSSVEMYDPDIGHWMVTGALTTARQGHTATLLSDGRVLVTGGRDSNITNGGYLSSAELYDPASGTWTLTRALNTARTYHTATSLPNGKVLIVGGRNSNQSYLSSSELYEPATGNWVPTGALNTARAGHTAALLPNGKVLVAGGGGPGAQPNTFSSAELYDIATGIWTVTGAMNTARAFHTATLLTNGKVLVVGGGNNTSYLSSAELYDPTSEIWATTGALANRRTYHSATLLLNGKVLIAGGYYTSGWLSSAEIYEPATGTWAASSSLINKRDSHTATLLFNGKILIAGGGTINISTPVPLSSTEIYDVGLGFINSWRPQIASLTSPLVLGNSLVITGSQFRGVSEGSSGNSQDSSTDYPQVQLRNIESGQTTFLLATNWSTNSFTSLPVWNFRRGYALATVFVNGIQSTSSIVNISVPIPTPPTLTDAKKLTNGSFQFSFTNSVGALFGALASTNLSLPLTNWTALGGISEISPGQFQFNDPQATNNLQRFYLIRSP